MSVKCQVCKKVFISGAWVAKNGQNNRVKTPPAPASICPRCRSDMSKIFGFRPQQVEIK
jgi:Zn finger protein HypA/HybF involved in hydrogenase expression